MAALVSEVCNKTFDVAIIGAGLSGLVAAYTLLMNSNKILKIAIIESRPNAGGRLRSIDTVDIGGAWTWPSDINLKNLAKELVIDTIPQQWKGVDVYTQGRSSLQHDYRKSRSGELSPCGIDARRFKGGTSNLINKLIEKINQYPDIEFIFDTSVIEIILSTNDSSNIDLSLIKNSELIINPCNIKILNNNIIDIYNINSAIIIAIPPQSISNIIFTPVLPLSTQKIQKFTQTWMLGTVKAIIFYKNKWWKDDSLKDKLSGASNGRPGGYIQITWDNSDDDIHAIAMFANKGANNDNIRSEIIDIFGSIAGENIEKIVITTWDHNEIYGISKDATGEYNYGRKELKNIIKINNQGKIFFCGTETENEHGHMEGAVISGKRVANEVLIQLKKFINLHEEEKVISKINY